MGGRALPRSDKVKATLAAWGMHLDFPPDVAGGALFPYLESMANQAFGMVIGQGGADTMIKALTGYLKELGGEVHLNAPVAEVIHAAGSASGIRLADGRSITARRAVIANVTPQLLFGKLLPSGSGNAAAGRQVQGLPPRPRHHDGAPRAGRPAGLDGGRGAASTSPMSISRPTSPT